MGANELVTRDAVSVVSALVVDTGQWGFRGLVKGHRNALDDDDDDNYDDDDDDEGIKRHQTGLRTSVVANCADMIVRVSHAQTHSQVAVCCMCDRTRHRHQLVRFKFFHVHRAESRLSDASVVNHGPHTKKSREEPEWSGSCRADKVPSRAPERTSFLLALVHEWSASTD